MRFPSLVVVFAASLLCACSGLRHPLDDSETRPETQIAAVEEAESTMDELGDSTLVGASFTDDTWVAENGCATAPFAPSQGDVSTVLIRTYSVADLSRLGTPDQLFDAYETHWSEEGVSVTRSSPSMDPGAVTRVHGIGYELVSLPQDIELRAFIPCY